MNGPLSVETLIERSRQMLDADEVDPRDVMVLSTRQARTIHMIPGSVIRIMRHEPMMWRGQWYKVTD